MLEDILLQHFAQYPKMEPQDAVKLIYQQEFGPEHMIKDPGKSLSSLKTEMAALPAGPAGETLYESIGNGLCRLNLRPCREKASRRRTSTACSWKRPKARKETKSVSARASARFKSWRRRGKRLLTPSIWICF